MTKIKNINILKTDFILTIAVFVLCVGFVLPVTAQTEKTLHKRALLIGISKYQKAGKSGEWGNLNTALDIKLLKEVLITHFNFAPADIVVLQDEKATKKNILAEWNKIVDETAPGDVVFVHFSGHGASIPDDNGDEIDGQDESLIPFDYTSKKDYSGNLRDDEIGKILDRLKTKKPSNVTVTIDSCYSGTATRGDYAVRGGDNADAKNIKPAAESPSGLRDKGDSFPKEYVFLAAASPRQTAKETNYEEKGKIGVFTLGLIKALSSVTPRTTYRDLFENVNNTVTTIQRDQNPQFEGALDEIVFDGTAVKQEQYVAVKSVEGKKDEAILQIGQLIGATAKSRFAVYAAGTKDPKDKDAVKLADGEIIKVNPLTSVLKLDNPVAPEKLQAARAFETGHNYEDSKLKVILQNVEQVVGGKAVSDELIKGATRGDAGGASFDLAEFREAKPSENLREELYDVKIYPAGKKEVTDGIVKADFRGLILERKDGSILAAVGEGDKLNAEIKTALERENRYRIVKNLDETADLRLNIELRLIPVTAEFDSDGNLKPETVKRKGELMRGAGGQPEVKVGDLVTMEIVNKGQFGVYVTILNLQANGSVAPGFPQNVNGKVSDNFAPAESTLKLPNEYVFRITEPLGEESFRAIATAEPTDFTPLLDPELANRGRGMRGDDPVDDLLAEIKRSEGEKRGDDNLNNAIRTPLGRILLGANIGKRTGIVTSVPPSWATSSITYTVKK